MASRYYQEYRPEANSPQVININSHKRTYFGSPQYRSSALEELNQLSKDIQNKYRKKLNFRETYSRPVQQQETSETRTPEPKVAITYPEPSPAEDFVTEAPKEKFYGEKWDFDTGFLKNSFWHFVVLVALIPLINSCIVNVISLSTNINKNFRLSFEQGQLVKDRSDIKGKIHEYHSKSGMKRTIKQEIKVIEKNEILIKLQ